jgi:hypothetical protein
MSQQIELVEIKKSIKRLESKIDQVLSIKNNDNDIIELKEYHHPHKIEYKDAKLDSNEKVKEWLLNQEYIFIERLEQLKPSYNIKNDIKYQDFFTNDDNYDCDCFSTQSSRSSSDSFSDVSDICNLFSSFQNLVSTTSSEKFN